MYVCIYIYIYIYTYIYIYIHTIVSCVITLHHLTLHYIILYYNIAQAHGKATPLAARQRVLLSGAWLSLSDAPRMLFLISESLLVS